MTIRNKPGLASEQGLILFFRTFCSNVGRIRRSCLQSSRRRPDISSLATGIKLWSCIACAVTCVLSDSLAAAPREDINPALLYWQAFAVMPDLAPDEQKHLLDTQWRTRPMDERAGELARRYDSTFKLLRAAAASNADCKWGVDLSLGPEVLLPHLAKAKRCANVAVLRARWAIQQGRFENARDDLLAAFVLGRNVSRDGTIISALVQIAVERIVLASIIQHWPELPSETIGALLEGINHAPRRGTMADAMVTERVAFYGWLVRKIQNAQAKYPGNDQQALEEITRIIEGMRGPPEPGQERSEFAAPVIRAAGGTTAGLLNYLGELEPLYHELQRVMNLPYGEFYPALNQLEKQVQESSNLLARELLPAVLKVRDKEFKTQAWLAMVRTAYLYRLDPLAACNWSRTPSAMARSISGDLFWMAWTAGSSSGRKCGTPIFQRY